MIKTIKLGNNDHGGNVLTAITNKFTPLFGLKWPFYYTNVHGYNDLTVTTSFSWKHGVRYNQV